MVKRTYRSQQLGKYKTPPSFRGAPLIKVQLWYIVRGTLFSWSPRVCNRWRVWLLKLFGAKIGRNVLIRPSAIIEYPWKVSIGNNSWIGEEVNIYSLGNICIGDNSVISQKCYLCSGTHDYFSDSFDIYSEDIFIGSECWLAADVYIAPGVSIVGSAVVGARSSVFSDIEKPGVYGGTPAKFLKDFYRE